MSGDAARLSGPAVGEAREGTTLVLGETSHDDACRGLAGDGSPRAYRVRAVLDGGRRCASTDDLYDTGVYDGLNLPDAGVAVSDAVANLDAPVEASGRLVVCLDGLPRPDDAAGRERLVQFLHAVTHRVCDANGRCHAHLAVDADDDLAAVVAPLFERVVDAEKRES